MIWMRDDRAYSTGFITTTKACNGRLLITQWNPVRPDPDKIAHQRHLLLTNVRSLVDVRDPSAKSREVLEISHAYIPRLVRDRRDKEIRFTRQSAMLCSRAVRSLSSADLRSQITEISVFGRF